MNDKATAMNGSATEKQGERFGPDQISAWRAKRHSRREVLAGSVAVGAMIVLRGSGLPAADGKKTFTILHTNDLHSNLIGMAPASDYTPFTLNDDKTRGGFARLATLIAKRKAGARRLRGLCWCSMRATTAWGPRSPPPPARPAANCNCCPVMGCDATTFGNHDFDLGPDGTAQAIAVAAKAGRVPAVVASNTDFTGNDPTLAGLQQLAKDGVVRRYLVIERGGMRFGIFGLLGKEAQFYTGGAGAVKFADPIETATRDGEGPPRDGEGGRRHRAQPRRHGERQGRTLHGRRGRAPAEAVPGIDVVIGAPQPHRTARGDHRQRPHARGPDREVWREPRRTGDHAGRRQADGRVLPAPPGRRHHCRRPGHRRRDRQVQEDRHRGRVRVARLQHRSAAGGGAAGHSQHVHRHRRRHASSPISCTDAFRSATKADIGFTANGMMRSGFIRGKSGVQTVYDVFAVAPLGAGVVDTTAGSTLVTGYFTGQELKNLLEFFLVDNPAHPGEYFPRASGMRFRYDPSRPQFDVVTAIETGRPRPRLPRDRHQRARTRACTASRAP